MKLLDFAKGDRVFLTRVLRARFQGQSGVVEKVVKSRGVVRVRLHSDGERDDAFPENIDKVREEINQEKNN